MTGENVFNSIKDLLDKNNIEYKLSVHKEVRTSEEAAAIRGTSINTGAKAMVVKANENYYLFVLPANKKLDWKKVRQILEVRKIRFATEDEVIELIGVKPGGVPPFGNVLNLATYFDKSILVIEYVNFNAGLKTHSIHMSIKDLVKLVNPAFSDFTS